MRSIMSTRRPARAYPTPAVAAGSDTEAVPWLTTISIARTMRSSASGSSGSSSGTSGRSRRSSRSSGLPWRRLWSVDGEDLLLAHVGALEALQPRRADRLMSMSPEPRRLSGLSRRGTTRESTWEDTANAMRDGTLP